MSVNLADQLSVRVTFRDSKWSSGFVYPTNSHTYVFTAKHAICGAEPDDCKLKGRTCDTCVVKSVPKTKIKIDKPDLPGFKAKHVEQVLQSDSKDLVVLVLKNKDHGTFGILPTVKIYPFNEIQESDNFISCGYPAISSNKSIQPIQYSGFSTFRGGKFCFHIMNDVTSNLECSKENLSGNSGSGLIKNDTKDALLLGIYTDTANMAICYGEIIDHTVNELITSNGYPSLEIENVNKAFKTLIKDEFTKCFSKIEHDIELPDNREVNLYRLSLDGKGYDYKKVKSRLIDCVPLFTLTRKQITKCREDNAFGSSTLRSVKEFLQIDSNNKVPELLLQGFLEAYLKAPKLYSAHQNEAATFQGAHINFASSNSLEIIHCLAMISPSLESSFQKAIKNILEDFPKLKRFDGLIDNGLLDSHFSKQENEVLKKVLIPSKDNDTVDYKDRLAIFIGYDRQIEEQLAFMQPNAFASELDKRIVSDVRHSIDSLKVELEELNIVSAVVDCFFVPFESTETFNKEFIESLK